MKELTKILFLCFPEYGASNVHFATINSLLALHGDDVEIHLASLPALRTRVPPKVTFHEIRGRSITETLIPPNGTQPGGKEIFATSTTFLGFLKSVLNLPAIFAFAPPDEYIQTANDFQGVIRDVSPNIVVVDPAYAQCRDAAIASKRKVVILSPNTLAEHAPAAQKEKVFNFPAPGSGLPYPLTSFWMKIRNIISLLFMGLYLPLSLPVRRLVKARNAAGYPGPLPPLQQVHEGPTLIMSTPSLDRPMIIPPDIFCVGPITNSPPLDTSDPIVQWMGKGKTVFINLGSIAKTSQKDAEIFHLALGVLLRKRPDVQVLWKLARKTAYTLPGENEDQFDGRLKIVKWLDADPGALMKRGKVVCSVNHGGSNSYHEALSAGVPQVICSGWYDCHDFGSRLAMLGVGRWGNPRAAPGVEESELTRALLDVIGDSPDSQSAKQYSAKAASAAAEIRQHSETYWKTLFGDANAKVKGEVEGRDIAAEFIYRSATGEGINGWPTPTPK